MIDLNEQFLKALRIIEETNKSVFITGRAGSGKSTLLQYFRDHTNKRIAVVAPTGVAALNIKGQTLHSFFNFKPDITPEKAKKIKPINKDIYKKVDTIVIDEVSMVRADIMDCIDTFLRLHGKSKNLPFGGIQMVFIGDLYQLPPVVTPKEREMFNTVYKSPYFFSSHVFENNFSFEFVELQKIYRQSDEEFIRILNSIRNNTVTDNDIEIINQRYIPDFDDDKDFYIYLTTTNEIANSINTKKLQGIKGKAYTFKAIIDGSFNTKELPTSVDLTIKKGAQIMLLNNDSMGRWVNGTIGMVMDVERGQDGENVIIIETDDGDEVEVLRHTWEMFEFVYDKESGRIKTKVIGSFIQYPLKLAWAITIHKAQGLTFDKVVIDIGRGTFSHGQMYVALSRCKTLQGMVLKSRISKKNILMDRRVLNFITRYQYNQAHRDLPIEDKVALIEKAIACKQRIEIVYLKTTDEKSCRTVIPEYVGHLQYNGRDFIGLKGFCTQKKETRTFHLGRILQIRIL
ncbi:MAG: AAA family ATPase [Thermodesulfovibrionales bacterium]|nr:AAA family ATPase [Thermodesulfovibrionales bacterium]